MKLQYKKIYIFIVVAIILFFFQSAHAGTAPYPESPVIKSLVWDSSDTIIRKATGSDGWPLTWADDGNIYTAYSDGNGFIPKRNTKLSMGFAKVEGFPDNLVGTNIISPNEQSGSGQNGKKPSGILMVDGVLYLLVRNADNSGAESEIWYSNNHGVNWTDVGWNFTEFGYPTFINFGPNYANARDGFVYAVSHDNPSAYSPSDDFVLLRCPKNGLKVKSNWEVFIGVDQDKNPLWSNNFSERVPVFTHQGNSCRSGISYNAVLNRYIWWQQNAAGSIDTRFSGGFGVYDAPEPWGPWTTVYFTENWDVGPGEKGSFPPKWISEDGKSMYLVFSGSDAFSIRKATITLQDDIVDQSPPSRPSNLSAEVVGNYQINLSWDPSFDAESGINKYLIYRNGEKVDESTVTSLSDTGLDENTVYTYQVSALNKAGIESEKSDAVSVTTLADNTPPSPPERFRRVE